MSVKVYGELLDWVSSQIAALWTSSPGCIDRHAVVGFIAGFREDEVLKIIYPGFNRCHYTAVEIVIRINVHVYPM